MRLPHGPGVALIMLAAMALSLWAADVPTKPLLDISADGVTQLKPNEPVSLAFDAATPGIMVTVQPSPSSYPGVLLRPQGGTWDLSAFGHVAAKLTNTGQTPVEVCLRLSNEGNRKDKPWSADKLALQPGESGTLKVYFGYSWGKAGYALNPEAISEALLYVSDGSVAQSFRIGKLVAAGTPGEKPQKPGKGGKPDPSLNRATPPDGVLLGKGIPIEGADRISGKRAEGSVSGDFLKIGLPAGSQQQEVTFAPSSPQWDLSSFLELRCKIQNTGMAPVTPRVAVKSGKHKTDWVVGKPLKPGQEDELTVPFISPSPWLGDKDTGSQVSSDGITGILFSADPANASRTMLVTSIRGAMPPASAMPDWLGKRPPVEGKWVKTFDDEFDGAAVDASKWNIYGENYWDKLSHFSKENVIVGDGVVRLRFSKKSGHQNDDPNHERVTDYACGYLDTFGKWTQRYGYFEARMKLPTAPGLWPGFWMMPERGADFPNKKLRVSTEEGGMEFDIMEHLTGFGPYRYNIAQHWDGYKTDHKQKGSDRIYFQPDQDGFVTAGLLWTPGNLVYYANGREVGRWQDPRVSIVPGDMRFTLPTGGWDNRPLQNGKLPDDFIIDYVRCWQREDLATGR